MRTFFKEVHIEPENLKEALFFCNIKELKELCKFCGLATPGKKGVLIERLFLFSQKKPQETMTQIPPVSLSPKSGQKPPLRAESLILKGSYKNNLKTRMLFKSLCGEHFHFTAFGNDWIEKRWQEGLPPTYGEFADYWQEEYRRRKDKKASPKAEWAYLNFIQKALEANPSQSRAAIASAWKKERLLRANEVISFFKEIL